MAVPAAATSGPGWTWDPRGYVDINGQGATFSGFDVSGGVSVTADDVTVSRVRITVPGETFGIALRHTKGATVEDVEITSPDTGKGRLLVGIKDIYGDSTGIAIRRADIARTGTGIQIEEGVIEDSYIHDMGYTDGDHVNGTTSNGGTGQLTIRHNTILNQHDQTDAVSLFQDFGPQANRVIEGNLLAGGGYTIYAGANPGKEGTATNISVVNNRIGRVYYPDGGSFGPLAAYAAGQGNRFEGNVWDDTSLPVSAAATAG